MSGPRERGEGTDAACPTRNAGSTQSLAFRVKIAEAMVMCEKYFGWRFTEKELYCAQRLYSRYVSQHGSFPLLLWGILGLATRLFGPKRLVGRLSEAMHVSFEGVIDGIWQNFLGAGDANLRVKHEVGQETLQSLGLWQAMKPKIWVKGVGLKDAGADKLALMHEIIMLNHLSDVRGVPSVLGVSAPDEPTPTTPHVALWAEVADAVPLSFVLSTFSPRSKLRQVVANELVELVCKAHERDTANLALCTENVYVSPHVRGGVTVLDWSHGRFDIDKPSVSCFPDTPELYRCPREWRGQPRTPRQVDRWALGCVVYEILAGQKLWAGVTSAEVLAWQMQGLDRALLTVPEQCHGFFRNVFFSS